MEKTENNSLDKVHCLVCSGGGIKGIALVGALQALYEFNLLKNIDTYIGTSIGAITVMLMSIGYNPAELYKIMIEQDLSKTQNMEIFKLLGSFGIDSGEGLVKWIQQLLVSKLGAGADNYSLKKLFDITGKKLIVCTMNLSRHKVVYIDYTTYPNLRVVDALRMSFGIPFYFTATKYPVIDKSIKTEDSEKECLYVDGGVLDNFPIHLCKPGEAIGLRLVTADEISDDIYHDITHIETYIYHLMYCVLAEIDKLKLTPKHEKYTINIDTKDASVLNFKITKRDKLKLVTYGYTTSKTFLESFGLKNTNITKSADGLTPFETMIRPEIEIKMASELKLQNITQLPKTK